MVQFSSYLRRVLCKTSLIFPRINGPNDLSTVVQLTNRLLRFWADGGLLQKSQQSVFSRLVITSWFAIALDEIKNKTDFKRKGGLQAV